MKSCWGQKQNLIPSFTYSFIHSSGQAEWATSPFFQLLLMGNQIPEQFFHKANKHRFRGKDIFLGFVGNVLCRETHSDNQEKYQSAYIPF